MKEQNIHIKVDQELYDKIKAIAKDDRRTIKATIQILLETAIGENNGQ